MQNIPNNPSSSLFSPQQSYEVSWTDSDWPKITQLAFMPKIMQELTISWFLVWCLNHQTNWL